MVGSVSMTTEGVPFYVFPLLFLDPPYVGNLREDSRNFGLDEDTAILSHERIHDSNPINPW